MRIISQRHLQLVDHVSSHRRSGLRHDAGVDRQVRVPFLFSKEAEPHPKDPTRLRELAASIAALTWNETGTIDDLQTLMNSLVELFRQKLQLEDSLVT
ncbi:hypothetical protein Q4F19_08540 [Sphingomonas sp. BIUV-7]|uniref:Uncharacterized protein n=1 Tax=Sphingomonas natans TaxID=3063330 RepID=A0ABT8Y7Z1_9SPHN|nr:hypothetical protein [Sphingomonas sp. BIUV-7]MDO6414425.1 hypothetical protein [Sphingomonas sp. BIUV-7]